MTSIFIGMTPWSTGAGKIEIEDDQGVIFDLHNCSDVMRWVLVPKAGVLIIELRYNPNWRLLGSAGDELLQLIFGDVRNLMLQHTDGAPDDTFEGWDYDPKRPPVFRLVAGGLDGSFDAKTVELQRQFGRFAQGDLREDVT